jgi:hypothetical protein
LIRSAGRHGHRFVADETDYASPDDRSGHWNKVQAVLSVLSASHDDSLAAVLWLDADAILSNFNFDALSLVRQAREAGADFVICRDLSIPKVT